MPLALVLAEVPGCQTKKLTLGVTEKKTRRVTQVTHSKRFYSLSQPQADYLTEAYESWFAIRTSDCAAANLEAVCMHNRLLEVYRQFPPSGDSGSAKLLDTQHTRPQTRSVSKSHEDAPSIDLLAQTQINASTPDHDGA